jgi:hypothetical protein
MIKVTEPTGTRIALFFPIGHSDFSQIEFPTLREKLAEHRMKAPNGRVQIVAYAWDEGTPKDMIRLAKDREHSTSVLLKAAGANGSDIKSIAAVEKVAPSRTRLNRPDGEPDAMYRRVDIILGG